MTTLSKQNFDEFYRLIGRAISPVYFNDDEMLTALKMAGLDARRAKQYERRVWALSDVQRYIAQHARQGAEHAAALLSTAPPVSRVYKLTDAGGRRSATLGEVDFCSYGYPPIESKTPAEMSEGAIVIRSIRLHPSLRRKGFLSGLRRELGVRGFHTLVLEAVFNPSLAYALHQKSLRSNDVICLSKSQTVNFETEVSPGPTFALKLFVD